MDKFKQILAGIQEQFKKLNNTQKIIAGSVLAVILGVFIFTVVNSGSSTVTMLFQKPLDMEDYATITSELENMDVEFSTKNDKYIIVEDEKTAQRIRMKLAQNDNLPGRIRSWDLFDMEKWTTSEFQRSVKLRRAIKGNMKEHLESLLWIEEAFVSISEPKKDPNRPYTTKFDEVEASVSIVPAPGYSDYLNDKRVIKGVQNIIAKGVDGLNSDNITITGPDGKLLNDDLDDQVGKRFEKIKNEKRFRDVEEKKIYEKIVSQLKGILPRDRFRVSVKCTLNFDQEEKTRKEILPMVIKKDNPSTPYSELQVKDSVVVSEKIVDEDFKGENFIPEGAPGQEPNIPPGYKERIDGLNTYTKDENVRNYDYGVENSKFIRSGVKEESVAVSVAIDGHWIYELDEEGNKIFDESREMFKRKYVPYPTKELNKIERTVKVAINYEPAKGDAVVVENVRFDRTRQFVTEDEKYLKDRKVRQTLFFVLISLVGLFALSVIYRLIHKEIVRRKRIRERELAKQRQMQRDETLRSLEAEEPAETLSDADKKRKDLQERAEQVASEKPEEVAKLIQNWLSES